MNAIEQKADSVIERLIQTLTEQVVREQAHRPADDARLLVAVGTLIMQHGTEDERADLASFLRNPQRYADLMHVSLRDLTSREPALAAQLAALAAQHTPDPQPASGRPPRRFAPGVDPNVDKV